MPVRKLLVANRAEIAVRIMGSAAAMGVRTVAVHPADDVECAHVTRADEAVEVGGAGPGAYLDGDQLVRAAVETGCDAVHPGYGFLSENAGFAARCVDAGLVFVGPDPSVIELLGDKSRAREQAEQLGIPLLPATRGRTDLAAAQRFFASLGEGAAVMVKALAGGGGRGMRAVTRVDDLEEAFERARSEAERAFGDGALYVEELRRRARHIEVQLVGDGTGAVVTLGDRDCSLQRRRQKLVEIAPAPDLSPAVREQLTESAATLGRSLSYRGLATVEFLVSGDEIAFLEVNPRIQVEHTVTEEVTGIDLVETGLRIAGGETLADLGLPDRPEPRGTAVQLRINTERLLSDASVQPGAGVLARFEPPTGRGVRVDTHGYPTYPVSPRYDSLLAKLVVSDPRSDLPGVVARARRALREYTVTGVPTNIALLRAVLDRPEVTDGRTHTEFVDEHLEELLRDAAAYDTAAYDSAATADENDVETPEDVVTPDDVEAPEGTSAVRATMQGVVVEIAVEPGAMVAAGDTLLVVEAMKMEHVIAAPGTGVVHSVPVEVGASLLAGATVAFVTEAGDLGETTERADEIDLDHIRADLAETLERRRLVLDDARPGAVERRHELGRRTARENIDDLVDEGSFTEYGGFAIAAQRRRRDLDDLIRRTPADGLITGTGLVDGTACAVMSYDYTVLAGTQGIHNHRKTDRLLELAARQHLPLVVFAEGGGGRPGDTDTSAVAQLDVPTFRLAAKLAGEVPTVGVVSGYSFAGNAALAATCDVIIATEGSSLGMSGPAMIEGGGLGIVAPGDVGPMSMQTANGVVDLLVADDAAAVQATRRYLSYFVEDASEAQAADQRRLRALVPENRLRSYDVRPVLHTLADDGSVLELRTAFGVGIVTALARIEGRPVGVLANDSRHLGGAIDADAADKAARFLTICQARGLPVVTLCDTPGFMVGPDSEQEAAVRRFGAMFVAGARLTVPLCTIVLRKAYGLGAMAMAGGDLKAPLLTAAWPTGEFGGMGLEGGVRLGYRKELDAIVDEVEREARFAQLVAEAYERGKALSVATVFELDDVIDPAETRAVIARTLRAAR